MTELCKTCANKGCAYKAPIERILSCRHYKEDDTRGKVLKSVGFENGVEVFEYADAEK